MPESRDTSGKLLLAADSRELLERLSALLSPSAAFDAALGGEQAAALAQSEPYDAAVWAVAAGGDLALRLTQIALGGDGVSTEAEAAAKLAQIRRILEAHARDVFQAAGHPEIQTEADTLTGQISALIEDKVRLSEEAIVLAEQENERLLNTLRETVAQAEGARKESDAAREAANRAQAENGLLVREAEALRKALNDAVANHERDQAALKEALRSSAAELDSARQTALEQEAVTVRLRQEAEELRRKLEQAEATQKSLQDAADMLRAELAVRGRDAEAALSKAVAERDQALRQFAEAKSRLDALQAQWEQIVR